LIRRKAEGDDRGELHGKTEGEAAMRARSNLALSLTLGLTLATALGLAAGAARAGDLEGYMILPMVLDTEGSLNGVDVACTGIGDAKLDPKWAAYPIRVEFSNFNNEYMTDAAVVLTTAKGQPLIAVTCEGPWILMRPAKGDYAVYAQLMDSDAKPRSSRFTVPSHGQKRVVLQFPDADPNR
jgi:hypothetical protein